MSKPFRFKEFELIQEKSAQRFGTDSMILGCVAHLEGAMNILDIGTGTGALALMMAQKHPDALVDAVEIDPASAEEARLNFENAPWSFRLTCYEQSIQEFVADETLHYDLVLSNPPYFMPIRLGKGGITDWPDERRRNARTSEQLDFSTLCAAVGKILVAEGRFFVVLPMEYRDVFLQTAGEQGLFPSYTLRIQHDPRAAFQRVVLGLTKKQNEVHKEETLTIYDETGEWTSAYKKLTDDFHHQK